MILRDSRFAGETESYWVLPGVCLTVTIARSAALAEVCALLGAILVAYVCFLSPSDVYSTSVYFFLEGS